MQLNIGITDRTPIKCERAKIARYANPRFGTHTLDASYCLHFTFCGRGSVISFIKCMDDANFQQTCRTTESNVLLETKFEQYLYLLGGVCPVIEASNSVLHQTPAKNFRYIFDETSSHHEKRSNQTGGRTPGAPTWIVHDYKQGRPPRRTTTISIVHTHSLLVPTFPSPPWSQC